MIENIKAIGQVAENSDGDKPDFVQLVQKGGYDEGDSGDYKLIITVNINDKPDIEGNFVSISDKDYTNNVFRDGLSYLEGRIFIGAVLRKEKYCGDSIKKKKTKSNKTDLEDGIDKNKKTCIANCLDFLEVPLERLEEVKNSLDNKIESLPKDDGFVILFQRNGQNPFNGYKDKFKEVFNKLKLNRVEDPGVCQLCGEHVTTRYDTCGYNCYTNDKEIFNKTISNMPYSICENCMTDVLFGRNYVNRYLTTWWGGSNVFFLPSVFNDKVKRVFDACGFGNNPSESLLKQIYENEGRVFKRMGECNTGIKLVFFSSQKSEWKITYHVNDVDSSRFAKIADLKYKYRSKRFVKADNGTKKVKSAKKDKAVESANVIIEMNDLSLKTVVYYLHGKVNEMKDKKEESETKGKPDYSKVFASNEARRYLNSILHGYEIDRMSFFSHVMNIYEHNFLQGLKRMSTVHRVYNFLVDCGCLERGWQMPLYNEGDENVTEYRSMDEFFETNQAFFDSNDKKAWFVLGRLYNTMIWESKNYYKPKEATDVEPTAESTQQYNASYLEKNFFFGRKYDWDTFMYFANQCFDLSVKYSARHKWYVRDLNSTLKELMVPTNGKKSTLSPEEAKYIFAWGMDQWFEHDKEKDRTKGDNANDANDINDI